MFANAEDPSSSLRIADLGSARMTSSETGRCSVGDDLAGISPMYSPPEAIPLPGSSPALPGGADAEDDDTFYDGRAYDMYSLSIIMWECWNQSEPELLVPFYRDGDPDFVGAPPFEPTADDPWVTEVLRKTVHGLRPDPAAAAGPLGAMPPALRGLLTRLWDPEPTRRPPASEMKAVLDSAEIKAEIDEQHGLWNRSRCRR